MKSKIKTIILIITAFIMLIPAVFGFSANAAEYTSDDGMWKYSYQSGKITLTEYLGNGAKIEIPDTVDDYPVVGLGGAFAGNEYVETVIVPEGVEMISSTFRGCKKLKTVILPESLKTIDEYTFYASKTLEYVEIKEGVTSIGAGAFWQCFALETVDLPESLTFIDDYSFRESGLTEITVPGGVETIPYNAFDCCYSLETVTLCSGVKTIEQHAFSECTSLTKIIIPASVTTIEGTTLENVPFHLVDNLVIYGYENTTAESFADKFGYRFVKIIPAEGVVLLPETAEIKISEKLSLNAEIIPSDASDKSVSWSSSNVNIATVDSNGTVTGKANGTAIITVKTDDGGFTDTCIITVHTHSYTASVTTAPSCTQDGVKTYICSCNHSYTEAVAKLGHNYVDKGIEKAPSCTDTGLRTFECSRCSNSYTETVPSTGHNYIDKGVTTAPSCTDSGLRTFECSECKNSYTSSVPATGHNYIDKGVTTAPSCTDSGLRTFECSECKDSYTSSVPATGHNYGDWVITEAATTDKEGKKQRVCSRCSKTETQPIPAIVSSVVIRTPSRTTITYSESIFLHADITGIPEGASIKWESNNENFLLSGSLDGETCKITSSSSGETTFTVSVVDANGNVLCSDTQEMTSKAGFFQKIIAFFKSLFGMINTYPE